MSSLAQLQACLCAGLDPFADRGKRCAAEALIRPLGVLDNHARLGIYRRNISGAHVAVLEVVFPVCRRVIGERGFGALAREYTWKHPTVDPDLNRYGKNFPAYLDERAGGAGGIPYLRDLALLEYQWHSAWFAADDAPFDFAEFSRASADPGRLVFTLGHSVRLVASGWPVLEIWSRYRDGEAPAEIAAAETPDRLVIARMGSEVAVVPVGEEEFALLRAIDRGRSLDELSADPVAGSALSRLPVWVARGWVTGFRALESSVGLAHVP